jgi:hypothetical protein
MKRQIRENIFETNSSNTHSICLQVGMKVQIKKNIKNYKFDAGKIKTITKQLPDFGKSKALD